MTSTAVTADDLVAQYNEVDKFIKDVTKSFEEQLEPKKLLREELRNKMLAMLIEQRCDSFKTEHGTMYKSDILNLKVENRDELVDWALENWEVGGSEMLLVSAQKDAVKSYIDEHGEPPPGISTSSFIRVNVRRS